MIASSPHHRVFQCLRLVGFRRRCRCVSRNWRISINPCPSSCLIRSGPTPKGVEGRKWELSSHRDSKLPPARPSLRGLDARRPPGSCGSIAELREVVELLPCPPSLLRSHHFQQAEGREPSAVVVKVAEMGRSVVYPLKERRRQRPTDAKERFDSEELGRVEKTDGGGLPEPFVAFLIAHAGSHPRAVLEVGMGWHRWLDRHAGGFLLRRCRTLESQFSARRLPCFPRRLGFAGGSVSVE